MDFCVKYDMLSEVLDKMRIYMQWSKEAEALDRKVKAIIKNEKSPEKLKEYFPDARAVVEFSNAVYPYPYRRNSVLAMIVQTNDVDVLEKFWDTYFPNDDKDLELKRRFLEGTNSIGQKMNRRYFEADLSPENKAEAEWFKTADKKESEMIRFKIVNGLLPKDVRNAEQKDRELMYDVLKYLHESLAVRANEAAETEDNEIINSVNLVKNEKNRNNLVEEIGGAENKFTLLREIKPYAHLLLRKNKEDGSSNLIAELKNIDINSSKNLAEQVFEQLDFPEVHYWSKDPLWALQEVLKHNQGKIRQINLSNFFEVHNGLLMIDYKHDRNSGNALQTSKSMAYCGIISPNRPLIGFHADYLQNWNLKKMKTAVPHEFTHALDAVRVFDGETDRLSDTEVVKFALMASYMEGKESGNRIVYQILDSYKTEAYSEEFVAKLMENHAFKNNRLLKNMVRLVSRYNQAKLDKDENFMDGMSGLMKRKLPNYRNVKNLYQEFEMWQKAKKIMEIKTAKVKAGRADETNLLSEKLKVAELQLAFFEHYERSSKRLWGKRLDERIADCLVEEFHEMTGLAKNKNLFSLLNRRVLPFKKSYGS